MQKSSLVKNIEIETIINISVKVLQYIISKNTQEINAQKVAADEEQMEIKPVVPKNK